MTIEDILESLGFTAAELEGGSLAVRSPIDGAEIARVQETPAADMAAIIEAAHEAFLAWREVPAPRRGELVRLLGEELRAAKAALGALVTLEAGKIVSEGLGEVQEMIDICDFAVGLSRQLYGLTIATERPGHRMMETWHPLGVVGDHLRLQLPGRGLGVERGAGAGLRRRRWSGSRRRRRRSRRWRRMQMFERALERFGPDAPQGLRAVVIGGAAVGEALVSIEARAARLGHRLDRAWAAIVGAERRRALRPRLLELGGNNADDRRAPRPTSTWPCAAIVFAAVGTAGQRCTTLRRLIVHEIVYDRSRRRG